MLKNYIKIAFRNLLRSKIYSMINIAGLAIGMCCSILILLEERLGKIFNYFAVLAIFISCLGLFGLSAYIAEQRRKEIGVRKVLGANITHIIYQLSRSFFVLVLISNLIAWPVAYIFMKDWLEDFAFKIEMSLWIFIASGIIALFIALLTVSYQAVKAATVDPIKSLRYE